MACIFLLAACGARGEDASQTNLMETLVSTNSYSRLSAVKELGAQRGQMIKDLMAILNSTNSDEVKMDAVVVLGEYRAVEAIPFLMDHLDRETNVFLSAANILGTQVMNVWGNNEFEVEPVSGALCQIGLPAIRALLSRIEETDDAKIARKCVQICDNIEGPEMTKIRLEDLLKMNDEKRKRARIESALADVREMEANITNKYTIAIPTSFDNFAALPEKDKNRIVWELDDLNLWEPGHGFGLPNQKPICRDLLLNDGYSSITNNPNAANWTVDAIDMAEKQGWTDLNPLIEKIYEKPRSIWLFERAFRYFRAQSGKPVSTNLLAAVETLGSGGQYLYSENGKKLIVSDEQLAAAKTILLQEPDKEAVLVYLLEIAGGNGGKGASDRGRKAVADVLGSLDRATVIQQLRQGAPSGMGGRNYYLEQSYLEWVTNYLGNSLETNNTMGEPRSNTSAVVPTRNFMLHGFEVSVRTNGFWPVAALVQVPVSKFEEVTNRSDEIEKIIAARLAGLEKEDVFSNAEIIERDVLKQVNALFPGETPTVGKIYLESDIK